MDVKKQKKLKAAGWKIGSVKDFLELSPEEAAIIEMKFSLSQELKRRRIALGVSQAALAKKIGSSQSRIAKAEANDPSISIDLQIRALLAAGASRSDLAKVLK